MSFELADGWILLKDVKHDGALIGTVVSSKSLAIGTVAYFNVHTMPTFNGNRLAKASELIGVEVPDVAAPEASVKATAKVKAVAKVEEGK